MTMAPRDLRSKRTGRRLTLIGLILIVMSLSGLVFTLKVASDSGFVLIDLLYGRGVPFTIPAMVPPEASRLLLCADLLCFLAGVICCAAAVFVHAKRLIPRDALACRSCGYNLTGLRDNRCPECGETFDNPLVLAARRKSPCS